MSIISMHNNVPDIYNTSRDFQLLEKLYDLTFNSSSIDAQSSEDITSTQNIRSNLIPLLAKKLGWFSNKDVDTEGWRQMLLAFPYLVKYKGSKKAISGAIHLFLNINGIQTEPIIEFVGKSEDVEEEEYVVKIKIDSSVVDTTLLEIVFEYILPVGWLYRIDFVPKFKDDNSIGTIGQPTNTLYAITINNNAH